MKTKKTVHTVSAIALALFALLTLFLSSSVIFDWFGIRAKEGNYVPFVVWANLICSLLYLIAVYEFFKMNKVAYKILIVSVVVLIIAVIGLFFHINSGGLYETKTIGALFFRIGITLFFALLFYKYLKRKHD
ncbi:MAG: hypothetical protein K8F54_10315 [Altibacter sp.]|uniref:hypothetical protein n=1 Tax=Altibacter sp. TaxID=2024823 RepID=UPI001DDECFB9|nr:hypothetical protein [Altibacter sp.]MBZ0327987.1 hypothetical protein [Altibacter sp.]